MTKRPILLYVIIGLLALSCILDAGTFLFFKDFAFEVNPIFLFLKTYTSLNMSIALSIFYKIAVNIAIIWLLLSYKPEKSHVFAFMLVISTIVAIVLQCFGAYQNTTVHEKIISSPPGKVVPLSENQAYSLFNFALTWYGIFMGFEIISFWVYERLYRG